MEHQTLGTYEVISRLVGIFCSYGAKFIKFETSRFCLTVDIPSPFPMFSIFIIRFLIWKKSHFRMKISEVRLTHSIPYSRWRNSFLSENQISYLNSFENFNRNAEKKSDILQSCFKNKMRNVIIYIIDIMIMEGEKFWFWSICLFCPIPNHLK